MNRQKEAADKAREIVKEHGNDPAVMHEKLDALFCEILVRLGYDDLVHVFKNSRRWYE